MNREQLRPALEAMWQDFLSLSPQTRRIHDLLETDNPRILNDHIALRTFDLPRVNIDRISQPFVEAGYSACGEYHFPVKMLFARHYEHPDEDLPKLFISEFRVDELIDEADDEVRNIIHQLVSQISDSDLERDDFSYSGRHWKIDYGTYQQLQRVSEYAAWVAAFGFRPNHFTVLLNALQSHGSIDDLNDFLLQHGFRLNAAGGLVKGGPDEYLEQSSTLADPVEVIFSDRVAILPGGYYEFARRYPQPDGRLYQGFFAASADRIFESTDNRQPGF
ncbi:DUF1338 domain-containing protein [Marinobacterium aestuariivivens]|uniref:2-oxoadipate dioxygenase/decarboxylase n=1 Tax=Marinobacterium aestuariivivens TaxID=1698799 RepID=A0ABW1ZZ74_9GAMM